MATPSNIISLLDKLLQHKPLQEHEQHELKEWLGSNRAEDALLANPDWNSELTDYFSFMNNDAEIHKALNKFNTRAGFSQEPDPVIITTTKTKSYIQTIWFRYAAAVILLFGVGIYLYTLSNKTAQSFDNKVSQTNILPGANKALLTLSDGTIITLDSAANGAIAHQGNSSVVKLANGEIRYDVKGISDDEIIMNTMSTPRGGQYQLVLPDGSKVWLNAASSITYPVAFTGKDRKIKITGEVYIEVTKEKNKPFFVDVDGKQIVEVLGTEFNINSYAEEELIKTTLVNGSVKTGGKILRPGEAYINGKIISTDINRDIAWKNGYFNFNGIDLKTAMNQLSRWYDIDVSYKNGIPNLVFGGEMERNLQLVQVLKALDLMGLEFEIAGRNLTVKNQQ